MQALAALLDDRAAILIAAGAGDAAAVFGVFALADAHREVALAAGDAVAGAANAAQAVGQHAAKVLQRAAGDFVFAAAINLAAGRGLFEFDGAARQNTPIRGGRRTGRDRPNLRARGRERSNARRTTFQQSCRRHNADSFQKGRTKRRIVGGKQRFLQESHRSASDRQFLRNFRRSSQSRHSEKIMGLPGTSG